MGRRASEALDRLREALDETVVEGVTTNLPFLRWLVAHPRVRAGETTTAFLTEHPPLSPSPAPLPPGPGAAPFASTCPRRRRRRRPTSTPPAETTAAAASRARDRADARHRHPRPRRARATGCERRQPLVVLEAMKMETPVVSPYEAVVRAVHVGEGDRVAGGALLVELEE